MEGAGRPAIRNRCTAAILPPAASSVHRRAWSRLDDIEPFRSDPFASARDAIRSLCPPGGVIGSATPAGFRPSRISPHLRPLPSAGIARRLQYCGPLRHPAGPACPSRGSGWRVHATDRASRVATSSIMQTCRRHYPGGNGPVHSSLASRTAVGLPHIPGGSAPALPFSRPARRSLAFRPACSLSRPRRPFDTKVLQSTSLPPQTALAATNRSDNCCVGFAPTRKTRLSTAHWEFRLATKFDSSIRGSNCS